MELDFTFNEQLPGLTEAHGFVCLRVKSVEEIR